MGTICGTKKMQEMEVKVQNMKKKVVIVGSASVGKTTIITQLVKGSINKSYE